MPGAEKRKKLPTQKDLSEEQVKSLQSVQLGVFPGLILSAEGGVIPQRTKEAVEQESKREKALRVKGLTDVSFVAPVSLREALKGVGTASRHIGKEASEKTISEMNDALNELRATVCQVFPQMATPAATSAALDSRDQVILALQKEVEVMRNELEARRAIRLPMLGENLALLDGVIGWFLRLMISYLHSGLNWGDERMKASERRRVRGDKRKLLSGGSSASSTGIAIKT